MLEISGLSKTFGGLRAISDVSLTVEARQIAAVIGPNGAGKSTLFNLITGHLQPDSGKVLLRGRDAPVMEGWVSVSAQGSLVALAEVEKGELRPRRIFHLTRA